MNADHKKHKNRITLRQWTPEEHLVKVCQSKPVWDSSQSQPNREFHKVMHIYRPYNRKKTQYAVKKSRSISKVSSWRDKRLYCIQKVNLSCNTTNRSRFRHITSLKRNYKLRHRALTLSHDEETTPFTNNLSIIFLT